MNREPARKADAWRMSLDVLIGMRRLSLAAHAASREGRSSNLFHNSSGQGFAKGHSVRRSDLHENTSCPLCRTSRKQHIGKEMPNEDSDDLERAAEYWQAGQPLEAGRLIFENLPSALRPKWASRILKLVLARSGVTFPAIEQILYIADHADEWDSAHRAFSTLRRFALELDRIRECGFWTDEHDLLSALLSLAELVAKVTYNATDPRDEFDEDSGWWIAACLRGFIDTGWNDDQFLRDAWAALCFKEE